MSLILAAVFLTAAGCGDATAPGVTTEPSAYTQQSRPEPEPTEALPYDETTAPPEQTHPPETLPPVTLPPQPEPEEDMFVNVLQYIPEAVVELKYATADNFTGTAIYDFDQCFLRYGTVKKLMAVQEQLSDMGLGLKIWDGFRPVSAQFRLWEVCPDPVYVANPESGYSSHSRGNTVDVTIVDSSGEELAMPSAFDDFSPLADRNYADCAPIAAENARMLQSLMEQAGFTGYYNEWWHYSDQVSYAVEAVFTPVDFSEYYAFCNEYITLRERPDVTGEEILKIPAEASFTVMAICDSFYYVNYQGVYGYVLSSYTAPVAE